MVAAAGRGTSFNDVVLLLPFWLKDIELHHFLNVFRLSLIFRRSLVEFPIAVLRDDEVVSGD